MITTILSWLFIGFLLVLVAGYFAYNFWETYREWRDEQNEEFWAQIWRSKQEAENWRTYKRDSSKYREKLEKFWEAHKKDSSKQHQ